MSKRTVYLWLTIILGGMFAFTLSFTLLGRVENTLIAVIANIVIGGEFLYCGNKLSKLSRG